MKDIYQSAYQATKLKPSQSGSVDNLLMEKFCIPVLDSILRDPS